MKQNNVHETPYRFSAHKPMNPMFTKHTNHETLDIWSPILHNVHEAPKISYSQSTYYSTHEAPRKTLRAINNVHENLLNKASHRSHNWWTKKKEEIIESHNLGTYEVRRTNLHRKLTCLHQCKLIANGKEKLQILALLSSAPFQHSFWLCIEIMDILHNDES